MSVRNIVKIDEEKCNGCGECVPACAEGAIRIVDGKARLVADNLCDGLGACLGECPMDAITVEEREAEEFDESAVHAQPTPAGGCPGSRVISFADKAAGAPAPGAPSALRQWPVQLHLVPPTAPYFQGADVLLAADCAAFAVGDFHGRFLAGKALAIACPKLDAGQEIYLEKLVAMIDVAKINTLSVVIMEVPCCGGLLRLAKEAVARAGRKVPVKMIRVGLRGDILGEAWV